MLDLSNINMKKIKVDIKNVDDAVLKSALAKAKKTLIKKFEQDAHAQAVKAAAAESAVKKYSKNFSAAFLGALSKLSQQEQEKLLEESDEYGGLAVPPVFDDMIISTPMLKGEDFSLVPAPSNADAVIADTAEIKDDHTIGDLASMIQSKYAEALAKKIDDEMLHGDGSAKTPKIVMGVDVVQARASAQCRRRTGGASSTT